MRLAGAILVPIWSHLGSFLGLLRSSRQNRRLRKQLIFYDFSVERNRHEPPTWASHERAAIRLGMNCFLEVGYGGCHG